MTYLTRALGAAHIGNRADVSSSIDSLAAIAARLTAAGEGYWAEQVAIQGVEARAALALAGGRNDEALAAIREAVMREDATEKSAVTPGSLIPAHELFGDMLMELKRPADALAEYRKSMATEPNRFRSLAGAMKAARATGDNASAADYARQIDRLTGTTTFSR
jgi:hypothetical protein